MTAIYYSSCYKHTTQYMETSVENREIKKTFEEILNTHLYLNWFGVYSEFGNLLKRPRQEDSCFDEGEFDQDIKDGQDYYDKLKNAVIFPDFYQDDQIGIVTLLRNDKLEITLTALNISDERNVEFVEAKTLGELLLRFPLLKQYVNDNVNRKLSAMHYHPNNDLT